MRLFKPKNTISPRLYNYTPKEHIQWVYEVKENLLIGYLKNYLKHIHMYTKQEKLK